MRSDIAAICKLPIDLPQGGYVPLGDVADIEIVPAPNEIKREKASRRIDITCNVKGRDLGSVAREIQKLVSDPDKVDVRRRILIPNSSANTRPAPNRRRGCSRLPTMSLIGILLLLQLDFRSWKLAFAGPVHDSLCARRRRRRHAICKGASCRSGRWSGS